MIKRTWSMAASGWVLFNLGLGICAHGAAPVKNSLTLITNRKTAVYSLPELKSKLKMVTVTLEDPVYKKTKTYDGFNLMDIFALNGLDPKTASDEIIFTAIDGYAPNTSFEQLRNHHPVLTFQEHGKQPGFFEKVAQGKTMLSPAPYYVVWDDAKKLGDSVPWPYQLVQIEVVKFSEKFAKLYPQGEKSDSPAMKGFLLFKNDCLRCHSINLQGGDVGPELNSPRNVTEYWNEKTLKEFIQDPSQFRYRDKMPPFPQLKSEDLDHILDYFKFMKNHQVKL